MSVNFDVRHASLDDQEVLALVALHLSGMHENSPPDAVFALDLSGLSDPAVTLWGAWAVREGKENLAAMGALKMLGDGTAEVKSMRTHPDFLRMGAAAALLETVIEHARAAGVTRLSLETGRGPAFEPALAMYRGRGFADGDAFADYQPSDFSQFLHLSL